MRKPKYNSLTEWRKAEDSAYRYARRKGLLPKICDLFGWKCDIKKPNNYWDFKKCKEESLKYGSRNEWRIGNHSSYSSALDNGWIDDLCHHMTILRQSKRIYTFEKCKEDASRYKTRTEWSKNSSSAYQKASRHGWIINCCTHMSIAPKKTRGYWTLEKCKEEALKYTTRSEWLRLSSSSYSVAQKNKWIDECCLHMKKNKKHYEKTKI